MSTVIDRRIADRRRLVREDGARRRMRWVVAMLAIAATTAVVASVLGSPWLAVRSVAVSGVARSDAGALLAHHRVEPGVPTISVRASAVEAALLDDPWIAAADVRVTWPGTVEVSVREYVPAGWFLTGGRWVLAASQGAVLATAPDPDADRPHAALDLGRLGPGDRIDDPTALGILEFFDAMDVAVFDRLTVAIEPDGALWATIDDLRVRLGRPIDMKAKGATLAALLAEEVPAGSTVDLIAPHRPAVTVPGGAVASGPEAGAASRLQDEVPVELEGAGP